MGHQDAFGFIGGICSTFGPIRARHRRWCSTPIIGRLPSSAEPARGIYDNMKTAVDAIFLGRDRRYNRRFGQMCGHYLVEPEACMPASGWEKGQVENQVGLMRERFFTPRLRFKTLEDLNGWLADKCVAYAKAHPHPDQGGSTVREVFEEERASFIPYAGRFDGFHCIPASVSKTCTVRFDNNKYSVLSSAVGRPGAILSIPQALKLAHEPIADCAR